MNRTRLLATALLIFLFASCAPKAAPTPTSVPSPIPTLVPTATSVPHASEIRFALIGNVTPVNVWALFDAKGYSYNNYAVMSGYWPRLYQLSIPDRNFETMAASGMPSSFQQEGNLYTATVPLRPDLKWTDGTPFTADDVAFTVNTAVPFLLGFDWHDFYNPDFIDHAEAVDAHTVKFYFKKQPNVGVWQYGALQGPIVQKAYWESKVSASTALLPPNTLLPQIASLTAQVTDMQSKINTVNANIAILPTTSSGYIQGIADIKGLQANLNQTNTALAKAQAQYDSAMDAARQSLYALDNANEPTLGDWAPAGKENGAWINKVNPAHPFNVPKFNSAAYQFFSNEEEAIAAYVAGDVDSILEQNGLSVEGVSKLPNSLNPRIIPIEYSTRSVEFLVFNQSNPSLVNPAVRQALGCITNGSGFANIPSFGTFIPLYEKFWLNWEALSVLSNPGGQSVPCQMANTKGLLQNVVAILKSAGYTWTKEPVLLNEVAGTAVSGQGLTTPSNQEATPRSLQGLTALSGQGLTSVSGQAFPHVTLLSISEDSRQAADGMDIENAANIIGIPLTVKLVSPEELRYDVFSSHQYDMALLGWQLSDYPGYLCDWFKDGNPFGYQSDRLQSACEALNSTSDLTTAQKDVYEIQSILAQDLPFIPLYSGITYDAYRNIKYPFDSVLGGLSGVYGAPSLAIPAP